MPAWRDRHEALTSALAELPTELNDAELPFDAQLHLALLRAETTVQRGRGLLPPLKRLRLAAPTVDDFNPVETLSSSGAFSKVELVRPSKKLVKSATGPLMVLKTVERRWAFRMRAHHHIRHEVSILRLSRQPDCNGRIPRLIASFLSPTSFHLLMAHAPRGDLWSILEEKTTARDLSSGLPEDWVRPWMAELVDAVEWVHEKGWAHRDIKPQNLLLDADGHLQLTDFGSAAPLQAGTTLIARKHCRVLLGTPDYIAPEVLKHAERIYQEEEDHEEELERSTFGAEEARSQVEQEARAYGAEVDWWACGVVMYELLVGSAPFFAEDISETYERIVHWQDNLAFPSHSAVSSAAEQAIRGLLVAQAERPSSRRIKAFDWFSPIDWSQPRSTPPAYLPPIRADFPANDSFAQSQRSFAPSFDYASFLSSPGLSILRPPPRTVQGAQSEEQGYWEARDYGGLTTLPAEGDFTDDSARAALPSNSSSPAIRAASRPQASAFETPARPLSRLVHLSHAPPTGTAIDGAQQTRSVRSNRRGLSEMDAWREMQEHAWTVGMTARKQRQTQAPAGGSHSNSLPSREGAAPLRGGWPLIETQPVEKSLPEREPEDEGARLGGLERRQRAVVQQLEVIDEKYRGLFELAAKEVV
ncbi:uncharacterized protein JCM10292_002522 [Rhodotorula paludigena]|uniref:uncharacterized protein n=1 Tax=Rhodotorula paludigena TaxID=86838 RepID=UPI00317CD969